MYEERVCCFIDILGWKSKVEGIELGDPLMDVILAALTEIENHWRGKSLEFYLANTSREVTIFSDSVVVSALLTEDISIESILIDILHMQMTMLPRGMWLRGAVTYGQLYHTKDRVFGPALNEAYRLESEVAKYPRVILDHSLLKVYDSHSSPHKSQSLYRIIESGICFKDTDDYYFIDQFVAAINELNDPPIDYVEYLYQVGMHVSDLRKKADQEPDPKIKVSLTKKAEWTEKQLDRAEIHCGLKST